MKVIIAIMFIFICITASAEPIAVGGDFGRTWISNYLDKNPSPFPQDNNSSSAKWGSDPKVQGTIDSKMVTNQNATNLIKPNSNWLMDTTNLGSQPVQQNFTQVPFFIGKDSRPIHQMDASWNYTTQVPEPDANGLIHGLPAETYDAIGPALDYF